MSRDASLHVLRVVNYVERVPRITNGSVPLPSICSPRFYPSLLHLHPTCTNSDMGSNIKPLILHAHNSGPNPYKVAILLEELQLPYEVKLWDFGDGPGGVKGPNFTKMNPNG